MADDDKLIAQDEIEQLLKQAKAVAPPSQPMPAPSAATEGLLGQDEIEALLSGNKPAASKSAVAEATAPPTAKSARATNRASAESGGESIHSEDIEFLLNQAQAALASVDAPHDPGPLPGIAPFKLEEFGGAPASADAATLELIRDVELDLKIELGRTHMHLEDVLRLRKGSVVPLDKLAGDPVDIFVNGRLIARGEVLVLNDNFCVRVAELLAGESAAAG